MLGVRACVACESGCTNLAVPARHVGGHRAGDLAGDGGCDQLLAPLHVGTCRTGRVGETRGKLGKK